MSNSLAASRRRHDASPPSSFWTTSGPTLTITTKLTVLSNWNSTGTSTRINTPDGTGGNKRIHMQFLTPINPTSTVTASAMCTVTVTAKAPNGSALTTRTVDATGWQEAFLGTMPSNWYMELTPTCST